MFSDDNQVAALLRAGKLLSDPQIDQLRQQAAAAQTPLYQFLIEQAIVDEDAIVKVFAPAIGIGGVSLKEFTGDALLMSIAPTDVLRREGILPVGIDEAGSRRVLYVAMADPSNESGIRTLSEYSNLPIVPLLAGPMDLLAAINRCADRHMNGADELARDFDTLGDSGLNLEDFMVSGSRPVAFSSDFSILDEFIEGVPAAAGGSLASALSLIDDIPRNRHSAATPPGGTEVFMLADDDLLLDDADIMMGGDLSSPAPPVQPPVAASALGVPGDFSNSAQPAVSEPLRGRAVELSDLFPALGGIAAQPLDELHLEQPDPSVARTGEPRLARRDGSTSRRTTVEASPSTGPGRPASPASGAFQRVEPAGTSSPAAAAKRDEFNEELLEHPLLLKAVVKALVQNGILSVAELRAALTLAENES